MLFLNNTQKDVIGYLRAVNIVLLLWNCDPIIFPLDAQFRAILDAQKSAFESLLGQVAAISCANYEPILSEIRSSLDDILIDENYYFEEKINLLFALYSGDRNFEKIAFLDDEKLFQATKPIFEKLFCNLIDATLWSRIDFHVKTQSATEISLNDSLFQVAAMVYGLSPSKASIAPPKQLVEKAVKLWFDSPSVQAGMKSKNADKHQSSLRFVLSELGFMKDYHWPYNENAHV